MNLFTNIKMFSNFSNLLKSLNVIIAIIKGLAVAFLALQTVMMLVDIKKNGPENVLKLS